MFGGAKGGGKTYLFCLWVTNWVHTLVHMLKLKPSSTPILLGFIGRKQGVDFQHTTLETFKKTIPPQIYDIRTQSKEIIFYKMAKVWYGGLDDTERIRKFNSAELAFTGLDQAEETERSDVDVLQATLRLKVNGIVPPYKQLYTANPAECWLKDDFINNRLPGHHYIPALPTDNPYLPDSYVPLLRQVFQYNPALLRAYLEGDWFALQAENVLITSTMLNRLREKHVYWPDIRRIVAVDPSLGGDECVIYCIENGRVIDINILINERDTMKVAGAMVVMGNRNKCSNYAGDCIGIGQGILDRIKELVPNPHVQYVNSSETAIIADRFYNVRAEMWWYGMTLVQDCKVPFPEDEQLRNDLCAMRFKVVNSNGQIQLEAKDQTKRRIGRSPDRGDAWIIGQYALARTEPINRAGGAYYDKDQHSSVSTDVTNAMTA